MSKRAIKAEIFARARLGGSSWSKSQTPYILSLVLHGLALMRALLLLVCALQSLLGNNLRAQSAPSVAAGFTPAPAAQELQPRARAAVKEKHPRLFWVMPTYTVSNSSFPSSLSSGEKFRLAVQNATDPFTFGNIAANAGIQQANNNLAGYGQGAAGYGKRVGAGLADQASASFFKTYLFPSILHQDPRYFRQGSGSFKRRLANAIIRPVVTRDDSGGCAFNWAELLGGIAASSLSNVYYPGSNSGVGPTFKRAAAGIPFSMIDHLIDEFGPDLERKFLRRTRAFDENHSRHSTAGR
jgi:hypothetical protein